MKPVNDCPKARVVVLGIRPKDDLYGKMRKVAYRTRCKSWKCKACSGKKRAVWLWRLRYGLGCLENGAVLITYTLRLGRHPRDAAFVSDAWTRYLALWKKRYGKPSPWLRKLELTKKGQPHIHQVRERTIGQRPYCWPNRDEVDLDEYLEAREKCGATCAAHQASELWEEVTGSPLVFGTQVTDSGVAGYLGKYLTKDQTEGLNDLGFQRTWSCSRDFPRADDIRLEATADGRVVVLEQAKVARGEGPRSGTLGPYNGQELLNLTERDPPARIGEPFVMDKLEYAADEARLKRLERWLA